MFGYKLFYYFLIVNKKLGTCPNLNLRKKIKYNKKLEGIVNKTTLTQEAIKKDNGKYGIKSITKKLKLMKLNN